MSFTLPDAPGVSGPAAYVDPPTARHDPGPARRKNPLPPRSPRARVAEPGLSRCSRSPCCGGPEVLPRHQVRRTSFLSADRIPASHTSLRRFETGSPDTETDCPAAETDLPGTETCLRETGTSLLETGTSLLKTRTCRPDAETCRLDTERCLLKGETGLRGGGTCLRDSETSFPDTETGLFLEVCGAI